jgi:hypothetical protein
VAGQLVFADEVTGIRLRREHMQHREETDERGDQHDRQDGPGSLGRRPKALMNPRRARKPDVTEVGFRCRSCAVKARRDHGNAHQSVIAVGAGRPLVRAERSKNFIVTGDTKGADCRRPL